MQYRFTQMAANVMHYSKEVAAELNHSYIGTEHILIGLLREKEGLACQVLEDHDVTGIAHGQSADSGQSDNGGRAGRIHTAKPPYSGDR